MFSSETSANDIGFFYRITGSYKTDKILWSACCMTIVILGRSEKLNCKTQPELMILSVSEGNNTHGLSPFVQAWLVNLAGIGDVVGLWEW